MIFILIAILFAIVTLTIRKLNRDYALTSLTRRIRTLDGTPIENVVAVAGGFWGCTFDLISMDLEQMFYYCREFADTFQRSYIQYFLLTPVYNIITATDAELVLNDSRLLTKGVVYEFLQPFLKTGLLTSTDKKWHTRRRLLTPAFHFNILTQFMETFKRESLKFVSTLNEHLSSTNSEAEISLSELIPRFTLNNICETALGVKLDDRLDGDEYRQHITEVDESLVERLKNPAMAFDCIYYNFGNGKNYLKSMETLHKFSSDIIEKRREVLRQEIPNSEVEAEEANIYRKQRYAMLDTLLHAEKQGLIDHAGICEEVDTFMFEGFDTTSMNLIFGLMCLSLHPEMQQKCYNEIMEHLADFEANGDVNGSLDMGFLNKLKYLDYFIKETQRLYPSVPVITRQCVVDTVLENNLFLPKDTQINIHIYDIHRNPKYFNDPHVFRPERHMASEAEPRHPFAFIPFSAGQRNCIGQKFALLEMKTLLVYVLKHFVLEPITHPDSFRFSAGILIRTKSDVRIKMKRRK